MDVENYTMKIINKFNSAGISSVSTFVLENAIVDAYESGAELNQTKLKQVEAENEKLRECVEKYAKVSDWQYSAHNSPYKNWNRAHPSDQEKINDKWIGGKWARQCLKEINEKANKEILK